MPYLLVADLPPDPDKTKSGGSGGSNHRDITSAQDAKPKKDSADAPAATATGSPSDLSFLALTKNYVIKLIYLPDFSHQQAIQAKAGWFGKASLNLQLADGTLTSLQANTDNAENGEVLKAAFTALATAATGGAAGLAASAASQVKETKEDELAPQSAPPPPTDSLLHPGLYQLDYADGELKGLKKIAGFCSLTGQASDPTGAACSSK